MTVIEADDFELVSETIPDPKPRRVWTRPRGPHRVTYLALGAGTQSSALYLMATHRDERVPAVDVAIFADTGDEPGEVYDQLDKLVEYGRRHGGPPIEVVGIGKSLSKLMRTHFVPIPAFTLLSGRRGMLKRQCTTEMKINPINRYVRGALLGLRPGQRAAQGDRALGLKGFTTEEIVRVKPSLEAWLDIAHPLIDAGMNRWDCRQMLRRAGLGEFVKSACVFCPYRGDREWIRMREETPEEFAAACDVDDAIRDTARKGQAYEFVLADGTMASRRVGYDDNEQPDNRKEDRRNGVRADALYLHPSCKPLREVEFAEQGDAFANECSGYCGV